MSSSELALVSPEVQDVPFLHSCYVSRDIRGSFQPCKKVSEEKVTCDVATSLDAHRFTFIVKQEMSAIGYAYGHYIPAFDHFEVGVTLLPSVRGKGIGTAVHAMLVKTMFGAYKARRLQAFVSTRNLAEIRVLTKCGFTKEGVLRRVGLLDGVWHDLAIYGLLASDRREVIP